jgi:hypothetical protein
MSDVQDLQDRFEQLEQEVLTVKAKMKAQTVRQRFILGLAIAVVGVGLVAQKGYTQANVQNLVTCRQLRVVDGEGNLRMYVGTSTDGEGQIMLYNTGDKEIVKLGADSQVGLGNVWVYDEAGTKMAQIYSKDGKGYVWTQK